MDNRNWWSNYFKMVNSVHAFNNSSTVMTKNFIISEEDNKMESVYKSCLITSIERISKLCNFDSLENKETVLNTIAEKYDNRFVYTKSYLSGRELSEKVLQYINNEINSASKNISILTFIELDRSVNLYQVSGTRTLVEKITDYNRGIIQDSKVGKLVRSAISKQIRLMPVKRKEYLDEILTEDTDINKLITLFDGCDWDTIFTIFNLSDIDISCDNLNERERELLFSYFDKKVVKDAILLNRAILNVKNTLLHITLDRYRGVVDNLVFNDTPIIAVLNKLNVRSNTYKFVRERSRTVKEFMYMDIDTDDYTIKEEVLSMKQYLTDNMAPRDKERTL